MFIEKNLKPKASDNDDSDVFAPVALFNNPIKINDVDAYLDEESGPPAKYRNLLHYMRTMDENDRLRIWINSYGGDADACVDIADAMKKAKGDVTVIVTGMAASAATIIALQAPKLVLCDRGTFMCHNGSFGTGGKVHEVISRVGFTNKFFEVLLRETYADFMTPEEIQQCIDGKDLDRKSVV
jgi:ATP-dependent protease ClpP protease subunit